MNISKPVSHTIFLVLASFLIYLMLTFYKMNFKGLSFISTLVLVIFVCWYFAEEERIKKEKLE